VFSKISKKEILEFTRVLSLLIYSRLSIINSIELILTQTKNKSFKIILKKILTDIKSGVSFSKSLGKHPQIFSDIYIANITVAEETGRLAEVLTEYTSFLEKMDSLKKKITQAARYPLLVIIVALGVLFFMMFFLIPTFEGLFKSVQAQLPPLTFFLLETSRLFTDNYILFIIVSVLLFFLVRFLFKNAGFKESVIDPFLIKFPLVSGMYKNNTLARFSLSMAILLQSGVTFLEALKISKNISPNSIFKKEIRMQIKNIMKGENFSTVKSKSDFFDSTFLRMMAVGEESSELDKVFFLMSNYYGKEFDHQLDNISSLIEPVLIIFVGLIVAIILVGMYLPMFEIINYMGV